MSYNRGVEYVDGEMMADDEHLQLMDENIDAEEDEEEEEDDEGEEVIDGYDNDDVEDEDDEDEDEEDDEEEEGKDSDINEEFADRLRKMESRGLVDIGNLALWKLSSFKPGCGLSELREDNPETYWQSDGLQPHSINIHFNKKVQIKQISLFTNYSLDESYTPSKVTILAGNGSHNVQEVCSIEITEPNGWTNIMFDEARHDGILKTFFIKVLITANFQNGKDTHIRSLKIFSPTNNNSYDLIAIENHKNNVDSAHNEAERTKRKVDNLDRMVAGVPFSSVKFLSESTIR